MSSLKVETMVCCFPEIHNMVYRALCDQASVFLSCLIWPHCPSCFQLPYHTDLYSVPIHHVLLHFQPPHIVFPPACNALFYLPWMLPLKTLLIFHPSAKYYFFQKLNLNFQTKGGPSVLLFQDILCFFLHHFALITIVWLIPPHSGIRDVLLLNFLSKIKSDSELPTHQCVGRKYQSQSCFCKTVRVQNSEGLWNA